jgi:hypothetical protein
MKRLLALLSALVLGPSAYCADRAVGLDLSPYFQGFEGCFVMYEAGTGVYTIFNEVQALERMAPCSTFKIVNTLIGLDTGVVADENTVFKWNGTRYALADWNRDLSLTEAIRVSAYWCYQRIARDEGEAWCFATHIAAPSDATGAYSCRGGCGDRENNRMDLILRTARIRMEERL